MSRFYVGQRVKVVRGYPDGNKHSPVGVSGSHIFIGCEATVVGTELRPNGGFNHKCGDVSIRPDGGPQFGMVWSSMLEPILPEGQKVVSWSECLWQPEHLREHAAA